MSSLLNSANEKCIIDAISALIFLTSNQNKKGNIYIFKYFFTF